jgi:hypothetical protein
MKRTIKAGPKTCVELANLLGGFEIDLAKGDRTEGKVAGDLFRMFQMTEAQVKQVNFREPTKEDRKERQLADNVTNVWDAGIAEDLWSYRLSETECNVLQKVIRERKGTYNFLRDAWEDVVLAQLAGPLTEDPAEPAKEPLELVARPHGRGRNKAAFR